MRWKKDNLQIFTLKKNVLRQSLFLEIVSSQRLKTNCGGRFNELLRQSGGEGGGTACLRRGI